MKSFIMNVPVAPPKVMTGNRQLTRGAFIINDFLRNPHFNITTNHNAALHFKLVQKLVAGQNFHRINFPANWHMKLL